MAKKYLRFINGVVLLLTSASAIQAGISMILDPSGASMGLPLSLLRDAPFNNYFIPGIILLTLIGISGTLTTIFLILQLKGNGIYLILQGILIAGWILIQIYMIQQINILHITLISISTLFMISGKKFIKHTKHLH